MKFSDFDTLTLDVVGTLIDFETGILDWFGPTLKRYGVSKTDEEALTTFVAVEDKYQREIPEKSFTEMLPFIYRDMAFSWGIGFRDEDAESFRDSIRSWPPFPDTVQALEELGTRYRLVAVTNADAWALEHMSANIGDPFQERISCDEVGTNKPNPRVFKYVLEKLATVGVERKDVLHTMDRETLRQKRLRGHPETRTGRDADLPRYQHGRLCPSGAGGTAIFASHAVPLRTAATRPGSCFPRRSGTPLFAGGSGPATERSVE